jgi:hypothetical protein
MGCMYATGPLSKCLCTCKGAMHALMTNRPQPVKCSPAAEIRCKSGEEGGECQCACKGVNHGLYRGIESFEAVRIIGLSVQRQ